MKTTTIGTKHKANSSGSVQSTDTGVIVERARSMMDSVKDGGETRNKSFDDMTRMEKRVALAEDVIASIKSGLYNAESGTYLNIKENWIIDDLMPSIPMYLVNTVEGLRENKKACDVCAIGSLFVSRLKSEKNANLLGFSYSMMVQKLEDVFSQEDLDILEEVFEVGGITDEEQQAISKFYVKHGRNDESRLLAIMENIVSNKGHFVFKTLSTKHEEN